MRIQKENPQKQRSVVAENEKPLEVKRYALIAFLDIEGAFNKIQPRAILSALKDLNSTEPLRKLIEQMFTSMSIISTLGASTMCRYVQRRRVIPTSLDPDNE